MRAPAVDLQRYRSRRRRQEGQWLRQERATVRPGQRRDGRRRHLRLEGEVPPRSVATNARHPGVRSLARPGRRRGQRTRRARRPVLAAARFWLLRSEEHTSELQSLMRISYAVFCLKKKTQ